MPFNRSWVGYVISKNCCAAICVAPVFESFESSIAVPLRRLGEVADYLKVTERTIYRLAAAKQIPAFKVGGSWRFSKADIDEWIKKQSIEGLDVSGPEVSQSEKHAARGDK